MQHGADQGEPSRPGDAPLEVGQLDDEVSQRVFGGSSGPASTAA